MTVLAVQLLCRSTMMSSFEKPRRMCHGQVLLHVYVKCCKP